MTMKNVFATSALILACGLGAGSSFAGYSAPLNNVNTHDSSSHFASSASSVLSRAEVRAEFSNAQKTGNLPVQGESVNVRDTGAPSTLSRDAVKTDFLRAPKGGTLSTVDFRG
jgi:hypothetical protein